MAEIDLNARVLSRTDVTPALMILRVTPEDWAIPAFEPGQFTVLGLPWEAPRVVLSDEEEPVPDPKAMIVRAYSIASSSRQNEYLEFYIALVPSGALTPRLFALQSGDRLYLSPRITGMFTLKEVPEDQDVVFLATGTGLAPYLSMLRTFLADSATSRRLAVLHGARHSWDLGYQAELRAMERLYAGFRYFPVISRPSDEGCTWSGAVGYLQDLWNMGVVSDAWGRDPGPRDTHIFLCGNPGMVEGMLSRLTDTGWEQHRSRRRPGQIHVEKYW